VTSWCSVLAEEQNRLGEDGGPDRIEPSFTEGGVVRRHTARRPVVCDDCPIGRGVRVGERYSVHVGLDLDRRDFFREWHCETMADECRAALPPPPPVERTPPPTGVPIDPDNLPF
jgi:hypothetical protein